jgi:hypothetical protein
MKLFFVIACFASLLHSAHAQGQLIFQNSAGTAITNGLTGLPAPGGPEQNDTQVGLYIGNVSDPVSSLQLINVTNCNLPGRFAGGTRTFEGWGRGPVQLQLRVWLASTVYPTYEAALAAALAGDTSVLLGVSVPMFGELAYPPEPARFLFNYGLNPVVLMPIPEPSVTALGLLALSIAALFRTGRRIFIHQKGVEKGSVLTIDNSTARAPENHRRPCTARFPSALNNPA